MLSKKQRLRTREVAAIAKTGRVVRGQYMYLRFVSHVGSARVAVAVPKRVAKQAVVRNRLRRAAYRIVSEYAPHGFWGVILFSRIPPLPVAAAVRSDMGSILNTVSTKK